MIAGVNKVYKGATEIDKIYLGEKLVYSSGVPLDPDAEAFLTATGITDATITSAINTFVLDLKGYGIWTKMKAIYPIVGGTATTHKFNLKDPRDLDAAFRLSFFGGITHSVTGMQGNGTNGYGNTHLNLSSNFTQNSFFTAGYSRSNSIAGADTICGGYASGNNGFQVTPSFNGNFLTRNQTTGSSTTPNSNTSGFLGTNRIESSNYSQIIRENLLSFSVDSVAPVSVNVFILALSNGGSPINYSRHQMASYYFGNGLTSTEISNLRAADLALQTTLSRNV